MLSPEHFFSLPWEEWHILNHCLRFLDVLRRQTYSSTEGLEFQKDTRLSQLSWLLLTGSSRWAEPLKQWQWLEVAFRDEGHKKFFEGKRAWVGAL